MSNVEYNIISTKGNSRLPQPYQEVEYIESSGSQYINTNVSSTTNTGMNIDFAYTTIDSDTSAGISGIYQATNPRTDTFFISTVSGKTNSYLELFHRGITYNVNIIPQVLTKYNVKMNWLNDGKANFNNGSSITNVGSNQVISKDIIIFGRLNNANDTYSFTKARCYGVRFSENSTIIRDMIPCYNTNTNEIGMYDLVNNEFYTNDGTGTFTKGQDIGTPREVVEFNVISKIGSSRLPSAYQEVEYIESDGTQYIDTLIKNTADDGYEIEFTPLITNDTQRYFGGLGSSTGIGLGLRNDGNIMVFSGAWTYPSEIKPTINQKIKVEYRSNDGWYLDNTLIAEDTSSTTDTSQNILVCSVKFNNQVYYPASMKLYSYKHKDKDGVLKRDLVPCYNKTTNVIGMYDLVNDVFYTNVGSGVFGKGQDTGTIEIKEYSVISTHNDI